MERIPRTQPSEDPALSEFDAVLQQFLAMPSRPAILLHTVAYQLETGRPTEPLTPDVLEAATDEAISEALEEVPDVVADETVLLAFAVLPELRPGETGGEYAVRLRAAAKGL